MRAGQPTAQLHPFSVREEMETGISNQPASSFVHDRPLVEAMLFLVRDVTAEAGDGVLHRTVRPQKE